MSKPQIFCFAYAGEDASFFDAIGGDLSRFDMVKIEYSGHGTRHKEPLYESFKELADDIYTVLKRIVNNKELPQPSNVFLAAHEPMTKAEITGHTLVELDEWVKNRPLRFGTIPKKLINNKIAFGECISLYIVQIIRLSASITSRTYI